MAHDVEPASHLSVMLESGWDPAINHGVPSTLLLCSHCARNLTIWTAHNCQLLSTPRGNCRAVSLFVPAESEGMAIPPLA